MMGGRVTAGERKGEMGVGASDELRGRKMAGKQIRRRPMTEFLGVSLGSGEGMLWQP